MTSGKKPDILNVCNIPIIEKLLKKTEDLQACCIPIKENEASNHIDSDDDPFSSYLQVEMMEGTQPIATDNSLEQNRLNEIKAERSEIELDRDCSQFLEVELREDESAAYLKSDQISKEIKQESVRNELSNRVSVMLIKRPQVKRKNSNNDDVYVCQVCFKEFAKSRGLWKHAQIHKGVKPHVCYVCTKSFTHKSDLTKHLRVHSGIKLHNCALCTKGFSRRMDMLNHMLKHTEEFKCDLCEEVFKKKKLLFKHKLKHEGKKSNPCSKCNDSFNLRSQLALHMATHGEEPLKCGQCRKYFINKREHAVHVLVHNKDKLYECDVCKASFRLKAKYVRHMDSNKHKNNENALNENKNK